MINRGKSGRFFAVPRLLLLPRGLLRDEGKQIESSGSSREIIGISIYKLRLSIWESNSVAPPIFLGLSREWGKGR